MRLIDKVGLEVETSINRDGDYDEDDEDYDSYDGFDEMCSRLQKKVPYCLEAKEDGSIEADDGYAIEVVSKPLKSSKQILAFMNGLKRYVNEDDVNDSMGFHIHMSFKDKGSYVMLFTKEFTDLFVNTAVKKFPDLRDRLDNDYCEPNDDYYFDRERNHDDRYKAVNIVCAYNTHKTIEFRFFRSTTINKMLQYTRWLIKFVQDYITSKKTIFTATLGIPKMNKEIVEVYHKKVPIMMKIKRRLVKAVA